MRAVTRRILLLSQLFSVINYACNKHNLYGERGYIGGNIVLVLCLLGSLYNKDGPPVSAAKRIKSLLNYTQISGNIELSGRGTHLVTNIK